MIFYLEITNKSLYASLLIYRRDKVVVIGDADGGDVEGIVLDIDVIHRIFQGEDAVCVEFTLDLKGTDLRIGNAPLKEKAVLDK